MACCQQSSAVILTREGAPPEEIIKNHRLLDLISSFWLSGPGLASENLHFQLEFLGDADAVGVRIKQIREKYFILPGAKEKGSIYLRKSVIVHSSSTSGNVRAPF